MDVRCLPTFFKFLGTSFCIGSLNGGMITCNDGVSTFTIFSADICDLNDVAASKFVGVFSDLCQLNNKVAFGVH